MKDKEVQAIMLLQFYDRRSEGRLTHRLAGGPAIILPEEVDESTAMRALDQLDEKGFVQWKTTRTMTSFHGAGKITALGVEIIEAEPPEERTSSATAGTQNHFTITNASGTVNVANDHSAITQHVSHHLEALIKDLAKIDAEPEEKAGLKGKLSALLSNPLLVAVVPKAIELLNNHWPH